MSSRSWILSSPRKLMGRGITDKRVLKVVNCELKRCFVKISTAYSVDGVYWMVMARWRTLSQIKWRSISMCLLLTWNTRFATGWVAFWLSHHINGGDSIEIHNSWKTNWIQVISATIATRAQYSDSELLRDIVRCLVDDQETRLDPRKIQ